MYSSVEKHRCGKANRQLTVKFGNSVSFGKAGYCMIVFGKQSTGGEIRREMTAGQKWIPLNSGCDC